MPASEHYRGAVGCAPFSRCSQCCHALVLAHLAPPLHHALLNCASWLLRPREEGHRTRELPVQLGSREHRRARLPCTPLRRCARRRGETAVRTPPRRLFAHGVVTATSCTQLLRCSNNAWARRCRTERRRMTTAKETHRLVRGRPKNHSRRPSRPRRERRLKGRAARPPLWLTPTAPRVQLVAFERLRERQGPTMKVIAQTIVPHRWIRSATTWHGGRALYAESRRRGAWTW